MGKKAKKKRRQKGALIYYKGKPVKGTKVLQYFLPILSLIFARIFTSDLGVFLSIIVLIPIYIALKYDGRILVGTAIVLLVISAIILAGYKNEGAANTVAIYAYWFLVDGVICEIAEYLREKREESSSKT